MEISPTNPTRNILGAGVSDADVIAAVEKSGYPLQDVVAEILVASRFNYQPEWCYVDRSTKELRTLDLHAIKYLYDSREAKQPEVEPTLDLLIECKQSELPYVFFLNRPSRHLINSPEVVGLDHHSIEIATDESGSTITFPILSALDLAADAFQQEPAYASSFSKCHRKGQSLELSGTEAYSGLVLPLINSVQHLRRAEQPLETHRYFRAHLVPAIGVLDAPMVGASVKEGKTELKLVPWVRVLRHEYLEEADTWQRDRLWTIDVVHKDFFVTYLEKHLGPFAEKFAERVLRHPTELVSGKGFVPQFFKDHSSPIETRLIPRSAAAMAKRLATAAPPKTSNEES